MRAIREITATPTGKLLLGLWLVTLACLVGLSAIGLIQREFVGYLTFSFLPTAILLNLSNILAYFVGKGAERVAKTAWISLCVAEIVLFFGLSMTADANLYHETAIILAYWALTLSFPSGLLALGLSAGLMFLFAQIFPEPGPGSKLEFYVGNFLVWFVLSAVGYLQWFKLVPYLIAKFRKSRLRRLALQREMDREGGPDN